MSVIGNLSRWVVSPFTVRTKIVDKDGYASWDFVKFLQGIAQSINGVLDVLGVFQGVLGLNATVEGHPGTLATVIQYLSGGGVIQPGGINFSLTSPSFAQITGAATPGQLPLATDTTPGTLVLPPGGVSTTLGSAAYQPTTAFDAAGTAATAAAAAQAAAIAAAATHSDNASNLSSGTVAVGLLPGISVTIVTAQLTGLGTQGSMTFTNGVLTAQTPAT